MSTNLCECFVCEREREREAAKYHYREALEAKYGRVWDSHELMREYSVKGFSASLVVVIRKRDKAVGTLDYTHFPRYYFLFTRDAK